jgi:spectinomycin phosphotransferase
LALRLPLVLCHGDIHRGNLMQSPGRLMLIDWEGMYLAPPEADLFFFRRGQTEANAYYKKLSGYTPNPAALEFFGVRRRLEDIYEFLVSLLVDRVTGEDFEIRHRYLQSELERLSLPMEFDFL